MLFLRRNGKTIRKFKIKEFSSWLNEILKNPLPENAKAINFNLYEEEQPNVYGIQLVATQSFDINDDDWACDEVYSSMENLYYFYSKDNWEKILEDIKNKIKIYIEKGTFSVDLKKYEGIGLGFVDGDLCIIYTNKNN